MQKNLYYYLMQPKSAKNFKNIYKLSNVQLYGLIIRITKNEDNTKDCMQEVYMKIWHNLDSYDSNKSQPITWMSNIARNHTIDFLRKRRLDISDNFDLELLSNVDGNELNKLFNLEQTKQLKKCLKQLKKPVLDVLTLSYFKGLTYEQISNNIKVPISTIKTWIRRSFPLLKKCMDDL